MIQDKKHEWTNVICRAAVEEDGKVVLVILLVFNINQTI